MWSLKIPVLMVEIAVLFTQIRLIISLLVPLYQHFGDTFTILSSHVSPSEAKAAGYSNKVIVLSSPPAKARLCPKVIFCLLISPFSGFQSACFHGIYPVISSGSTTVCPASGKSFTFGSISQLLRGCIYGPFLV